ncbi:MAG: hypothetical protein IJD88_04845 [Clostridia bacterium]|nr:hypothetical protein [Clostridia bacterium]
MIDFNGIPQGFGMALTKNPQAMNNFSNLSKDEKKKIIDLTRSVRSKEEMNRIVSKLEKGKNQFF